MTQRYSKYKDSGIEWIGEIPEHWEVRKLKYVFIDFSKKNMPNETLLSVTQDQGVVPRDWVENRMVMPSGNLESFKFIEKGDFCISLRSFEGGLEYCHHNGIVSPAYTVLKGVIKYMDVYYKFLFKSKAFIDEMQLSIVGIREGKNVSYELLKYSCLPIPPLPEQEAIAQFLDEKCARIDEAVRIKEKQIDLLKEYRQIAIHQAVTKGLNDQVKMKDSGIDWIGEIPEHWEVKRVKNILTERNIRSLTGNEPLFMVSQTYGLIKRAEYSEKVQVAATNEGAKLVYPNDLVFNKLKPHLGVFYKNRLNEIGIVSPDYAVYYSNKIQDILYFEFLFKTSRYIDQFKIRATGIVEGLIRLYTGDLYGIHLALPPAIEQAQIIIHIESLTAKIDEAVRLKEQQIEQLKQYKNSLINDVVTGKVRVA